jgi:hypothetical protein
MKKAVKSTPGAITPFDDTIWYITWFPPAAFASKKISIPSSSSSRYATGPALIPQPSSLLNNDSHTILSPPPLGLF